MMNIKFPTVATAVIPAGFHWGAYHPDLYANASGRHMGCDFASAVGVGIYAACDGVVEKVDLVGAHGYGRYVVIQHDGFKTLYAHLHTVGVIEGVRVQAGQMIGTMGGDPKDNDKIDGASSGAHLHFEVILPMPPTGDYVATWAGYTVEPVGYLMQRYAEPPKYKVTVNAPRGVNVREDMSTSAHILGGIGYHQSAQAVEIIGDATYKHQWAKLWSLRDEYAAIKYNGEVLMEVVEYTPSPEPTPDPSLDEKAIRRDEIERMMGILQGRLNELA